jgi:hypothetical protein
MSVYLLRPLSQESLGLFGLGFFWGGITIVFKCPTYTFHYNYLSFPVKSVDLILPVVIGFSELDDNDILSLKPSLALLVFICFEI